MKRGETALTRATSREHPRTEDTHEQTKVGSQYYARGHHWKVVGHGTRDGEPSVLLVCLTGSKKKVSWNVIERLFLRNAEEVKSDA